jgi:hypothetical protein
MDGEQWLHSPTNQIPVHETDAGDESFTLPNGEVLFCHRRNLLTTERWLE